MPFHFFELFNGENPRSRQHARTPPESQDPVVPIACNAATPARANVFANSPLEPMKRELRESHGESATKCIATSNKCLTSSNKKLLGTSASLLVTSALLVSNKKLLGTSASLLVTSALLVVTRSY